MRCLMFLLAALFCMVQAHAVERVSTVLEMFTSSKCPACPAAEKVLQKLAEDKSTLALSYHVNIFKNKRMSTDPFTFDGADIRQRTYIRNVGGNAVYTPHLVVNGKEQMNGSNAFAARWALWQSGALADITISITTQENGHTLVLPKLTQRAALDVWQVVYHTTLNSGRTHSVKSITHLGTWQGNATTLPAPAFEKDGYNAAYILQKPAQGSIVAAYVQ